MPRGCCARLVDALFCRCFRRSDSGVDGDLGEGQRHDLSLNVLLTGECGVGKTSLRNRWVDGVFTGDVAPTFGVDFNSKMIDLVRDNGSPPRRAAEPSTGHDNGDDDADLKVKINIYDTSGKPRYREVNSGYMLSFDAMVCVYDISAKRTLNVGSQTGQDVAAELGVPFMEVSAKSGANVHEAFMAVVTKAVGEHLAREDRKSGGAGVSQKRTGKEKGGLQVTCACSGQYPNGHETITMRSGSRSLVHSGGYREVGEGRTSPGRRGVSPIGRASYPHTTSPRGGRQEPVVPGPPVFPLRDNRAGPFTSARERSCLPGETHPYRREEEEEVCSPR